MKHISSLINNNRLWQRHNELANHGKTENGGVNRQALSNEDLHARKHIINWLKKLNIEVFTDGAANLFFRLEGINKNSPPVLTGSHIDSQPSGGKYDGVFGVLAGIEIIEVLRENNIVPKSPIEVVAWMNEEGSRFAPGMMGSAVFSGARSIKDVNSITDDNGITVSSEINKMHSSFPNLEIKEFGREITLNKDQCLSWSIKK
jgi:N-carbamoyl-L-amino-acid hydrolase